MTPSINHQFFFPHSPEEVWEYLTNAELMELWLMKNDFQPVKGHDFQFRTKSIPSLDFDGIVYCRVLEIIPFKKLSYSWKCGPGNGRITVDSVVVWTLLPKDMGTELFLEHSGFSKMENLNMYTAMNNGWLQNIQKIAERIKAAKHGTTNT
ncbi:MAG: SRPBCC domain-containing protein [Bacteroidota bacterium]|nr:SRPBCC domain-containing protein [Bacteroidota bacterium]MDP4252057.1 SRPBCC domain-containing protein [Bacteroidota bacterium]